MKTFRNLALLAVAVLFGAAAFAAGGVDPLLAHFGVTQADALGLMLLANAPVGLPEIKHLVDDIEKGFVEFRLANDQRLEKLEKSASTSYYDEKLANIQADLTNALALKKEIERVEAKTNLQGLFDEAKDRNPDKAAYKAAFIDRFVRKGEDSADLKALQAKAWSIGTPADGGYALPEQIDRALEKLLRDISNVRALANVVTVGTSDYKKLVNVNGIASGWVGEAAARPATNTSQLAEVAPPMGELYANPQVTQQALDVFGDDVDLQIDGRPDRRRTQRCHRQRGRDQGYLEPVRAQVGHGQRDAVDGDGPLLDQIAGQRIGQGDPHDLPMLGGCARDHRSGAIDVPLDDVPAEAAVDRRGALEVDPAADLDAGQA